MSRSTAVGLLLISLLVTGCAEGQKVGSEQLEEFPVETAAPRLGEGAATPSPVSAPAVTPAPAKTAAVAPAPAKSPAAPAKKPPPPKPARTPAAAVLTVNINGDDSDKPQFDPAAANVFVGTQVKFVNKDATPRSVRSSDGKTMVSPEIPPGGSWSWTAEVPGKVDYSDGTRPYAVGSITVQSRG